MSMPERRNYCALLAVLSMGTVAFAAEGPRLGMPVSPATITARDISIPPDGNGLPAGSGTAVTGEKVYLARCVACHGEKGQDGLHDRLVGGHGSLTSTTPVKTVGSYWPYATTLFDYVRRAMPYQEPRSLEDGEVYALTAYLLYLNGIVGQQEVLNATTLPKVKMPNRDNFVWTQEVPGATQGR